MTEVRDHGQLSGFATLPNSERALLLTCASLNALREITQELLAVFRDSRNKHEAHVRARPILEGATRSNRFLSCVLERYLADPESLNRKNYPVVGITAELNPFFSLVVNGWIPLPSRSTDVSTKMIHHHGDMLLSTATLFGPGYEHWLFSKIRPHDEARDLYAMDVVEAAAHPCHHVAFVDAWTPHTPFYPSDLSITLCLWSHQHPVTWRDHMKRSPLFRGRESAMRDAAKKLGLRRTLDLKIVENFDYVPTAEGFQVMRERQEFALGPTEDHLASLFCIMQRTGNDHLARVVRRQLANGTVLAAPDAVIELTQKLERQSPIDGKLSEGLHYDIPYANFSRDDVRAAAKAVA